MSKSGGIDPDMTAQTRSGKALCAKRRKNVKMAIFHYGKEKRDN